METIIKVKDLSEFLCFCRKVYFKMCPHIRIRISKKKLIFEIISNEKPAEIEYILYSIHCMATEEDDFFINHDSLLNLKFEGETVVLITEREAEELRFRSLSQQGEIVMWREEDVPAKVVTSDYPNVFLSLSQTQTKGILKILRIDTDILRESTDFAIITPFNDHLCVVKYNKYCLHAIHLDYNPREIPLDSLPIKKLLKFLNALDGRVSIGYNRKYVVIRTLKVDIVFTKEISKNEIKEEEQCGEYLERLEQAPTSIVQIKQKDFIKFIDQVLSFSKYPETQRAEFFFSKEDNKCFLSMRSAPSVDFKQMTKTASISKTVKVILNLSLLKNVVNAIDGTIMIKVFPKLICITDGNGLLHTLPIFDPSNENR